MPYSALTGGHAPGDLRDAFVTLIESGDEAIELDEQFRSLDWLVGHLWDCTDILPRTNCDDLDLPRGSTYAQAARSLKNRVTQSQMTC